MAAEPRGSSGWEAVRLTEARQVAALMDHHRDDWPDADVGVAQQFAVLRTRQDDAAALDYLAHALPRLEAVAWAARLLENAAARTPPSPAARHALDTSLRWLGEQTDTHRRAARDAAEAIGRPVAERHLGQAVFYSGGSINDPDQPPLWPPENTAARYVAAAIGEAAQRSGDPNAFVSRALDLGQSVAERGLPALAR